MNELENARKIINEADKKIAELFEERMRAAEQIAKYKKSHGLSVLDASRERELIFVGNAFLNVHIITSFSYSSTATIEIVVAYVSVPEIGERLWASKWPYFSS